MKFPVDVALAKAVPVLPAGEGWWYEPKFDGHRMILARTADAVVLYARSGRIVTPQWIDLSRAGEALLPGTVLDGEAVIWLASGRIDFSAAQSRAASAPARARLLSHQHPAAYAVWDLLSHPELGDIRAQPYVERRGLLLGVLSEIGPPIQPVPATDDRPTALVWYEALQARGIEGIVAKRADAPYPGGRRGWVKIRHADTADATVVGYVGARSRPRALALALEGEVRMSARLDSVLAARVGVAMAGVSGLGPAAAGDERYTAVEASVVVEVLVGSGRHGLLTVTRIR
ncbi:DNA ligase [Streptomyces sp. NPDC058280]|uniref:ATP-dependent DNA ligase n=1 Tax=Streptomyces sp. NPDC058280 TaxID=3346419 RepID=UPI0036ED8095